MGVWPRVGSVSGAANRRKRSSAEEGRRLLLDAGRELVHEQPAGWPLGHIRLTEVAQRAGVTAGALYHYWDTQEDYRDDLLDDLLSPDRFPPPATVSELLSAIEEERAPIEELVRLGADAEFRALEESPDLRVLMAMWAANDPAVNRRIAVQYGASGDRWAGLYEATCRYYGLEIRPPFTVEMVATILAALTDGLVVRASVDPDAVPRTLPQVVESGETLPWGLLGCALLAFLSTLSRPVGSDEDLWGLVDRLRSSASGQHDRLSPHEP